MDREEYLKEAESLPKDQAYRLILGYAWERLIEGRTAEESKNFIWPGAGPNPNPIISPFEYYGNFLAFPEFPWAFLYPGWPKDRQKRFRELYTQAGFKDLPIGIWGDYSEAPYMFDYSTNPIRYSDILYELIESGINPTVFVITDAVNTQTGITPSKAQKFVEGFLPYIKIVKKFALGWELNQVKGWNEKEGNLQSGHDMIKLTNWIHNVVPEAEIYTHLQPNWWAPHYEGKKEIDYWKDNPNCSGLLFQIYPDSSLSLTLPVENEDDDPKSEDGLYLALKYKGSRPDAPGVAGRITALGKKFIMFEHSRNLGRYLKVKEIISKDSRVLGIC